MNPNPADYAFPAPLTEVRIQWLTEKGVDSQVAAIDLEMVKMKLADEEEGEGGRARGQAVPTRSLNQ